MDMIFTICLFLILKKYRYLPSYYAAMKDGMFSTKQMEDKFLEAWTDPLVQEIFAERAAELPETHL